MRQIPLVILLTLLASSALGTPPQDKQEERVIYGRVTDEKGKPLPNIRVLLEYAPFGVVRNWTTITTATTSANGEYRFPVKGKSVDNDLPSGNYRLTFKHPGWQVSRTTQIGLDPSGSERTPVLMREVNVQLEPEMTSALPPPLPPPVQGGPPDPPDNNPTPMGTPSPMGTPLASPTPKKNPTPAASATSAPTPKGTPNTNPTPAPEPPSSEIDRILQNLDWGNIAFNVPDSMTLDEAKKVELVLSPSHSPEDLKKVIEDETDGTVQVERIQISNEMEASLTGDGFAITEVLPARRAVSKTGVTEWTWDVRANKSGKLRLHLTLNALVTVAGTQQLYPIRTFDKEYVVNVSWHDKPFFSFIEQNWQWLWTAILVPVGAWLWNRKRREKSA